MGTLDKIRLLCKEKGISITTLETELGFGNGSISKSSTQFMRSDRLLAIAKYFGVSMEYLMDEPKADNYEESYYLNEETKDFAQFLFDNPEYKVLFDASRKVKPEDMKKALKAIGIFIDE